VKIRGLLFLVVLLAVCGSALGQGFRFDSQISAEMLTSAIPGTTNVLVIPSTAQVAFCNFPANAVPCTNKATTYTSVTLGTPCSTSTQIVLTGTTSCVASPDAQQNWGVWVPSGQYSYTATIGGSNFGPYVVNFGVPTGTNLSLGSLRTTGALIANGGLTANSVNNVQYCDQFAGATADVQINAAVAALTNGGTIDCRGYGATSQTIAATVTIGQFAPPGKTITALFDRSTKFTCTMTNNTDCFVQEAGTSVVATGTVALPNAGIQGAPTSVTSALYRMINNPASNLVGGYVEGLTVTAPLATGGGASPSDAICAWQNNLQITKAMNMTCSSTGATNVVVVKVFGTSGNAGGGVLFDNVQFDGEGHAGARPFWAGCANVGSLTLITCNGVGSIEIGGTGTIGHPGSGLPAMDFEGTGSGGVAIPVNNIILHGFNVESSHATDIGILAAGVAAINIWGVEGTCGGACGTDLFKITNPGSGVTDGVWATLDNSGGWTNTVNNTVTSKTFAFATFPRVNYTYSAARRVSTIVDGGALDALAGVSSSNTINAAGLQMFNTSTTCTTAGSVGATCTTANITLPVAEADINYRAVCIGRGSFASGVPVVVATTPVSGTQFTITIAALTAVGASFTTYDCTVGHN
jgi:hypothetical protein